MTKNILTKSSPSLTGVASPEFFKHEFDAAIWLKGYTVILERALRCPCHAPDAPLIDCQNCFGTGYFYVNPIKTQALITGINQNNRYKSWSEELLGTIAVTVQDTDKANLSYFDKITIKNQFSYYSENLDIRRNQTNSFVFTTYKPIKVLAVYVFVSSNQPLLKLDETSYYIKEDNGYCLVFNEDLTEEKIVSVYYMHELEYHVLDLPHEIRASWEKDKKTGALIPMQLPVQAIARRSHLIAIEKPNFDGSGVMINQDV
mgnify:CR=1 FL=1|jgi:hypothetical protein|uniref:Uncharacterized protein n=1 Tax=Siphoviridae sp. ctxc31 TaxID=2826520 RepID=A0A8S5MMN7_9CAUD|nr:MAG TPA: hypothetical protein [Siphoviridae sp. ctxc31]